MVFDGKHLTRFDEQLLDELKAAQGAPVTLEGPLDGDPSGPNRRSRRVGGVVMGAFVVMALVLGVVAATSRGSGGGGDTDVSPDPKPGFDHGVAEQQVLAAVAQTTAAGSFDLSYRFSESPAEHSTPTTACTDVLSDRGGPVELPADGSTKYAWATGRSTTYCMQSPVGGVTVTGSGTVTVAPKSMQVSADISGGLQVSVRVVGDQVWESGGAEYGSDGGVSSPGQPLSGFASLVLGTLGPREGALAMTRMASPNAYLSVEQVTVDGARATGTGTVDGVPVTTYEVAVDLDRLAHIDGLSADERTTIEHALDGLHDQGYAGTVDTISVDAAGMIRRVVSVSSFGDGGSVTYDATYSNFGCDGGPSACPAAPTTTATTATTASSSSTEAPTTTDTTVSDTIEPTVSTETTATPPPGQ